MEAIRKPALDLVKDFCRLMVRNGSLYPEEAQELFQRIETKKDKAKILIDLATALDELDMSKNSFITHYFDSGILSKYQLGGKIKVDRLEIEQIKENSKVN